MITSQIVSRMAAIVEDNLVIIKKSIHYKDFLIAQFHCSFYLCKEISRSPHTPSFRENVQLDYSYRECNT